MTLLTLIGVLLIVGLLMWGVKSVPWIDDGIKRLIYIVVVVVIGLWLIKMFFGASLSAIHF